MERPKREQKDTIYAPPLLLRIEAELNSNEELFIAGSNSIKYDEPHNGYIDTVNIFTSPLKPIYQPRELNSFARSLIRAKHVSFSTATDRYYPAEVTFNEPVALIEIASSKKITTWDSDGNKKDKFIELPVKHTTVKRRIYVNVFPLPQLAKIAMEHDSLHPNCEWGTPERELLYKIKEASRDTMDRLQTIPISVVTLELFKNLVEKRELRKQKRKRQLFNA